MDRFGRSDLQKSLDETSAVEHKLRMSACDLLKQWDTPDSGGAAESDALARPRSTPVLHRSYGSSYFPDGSSFGERASVRESVQQRVHTRDVWDDATPSAGYTIVGYGDSIQGGVQQRLRAQEDHSRNVELQAELQLVKRQAATFSAASLQKHETLQTIVEARDSRIHVLQVGGLSRLSAPSMGFG